MRLSIITAGFGLLALGAFVPAAAQSPFPEPDADAVQLTLEETEAAHAFMETIFEPAAELIWNSVGYIINEDGEHDLSPQTDEEWMQVAMHADDLGALADELKHVTFAPDTDVWIARAQAIEDLSGEVRTISEAHSVEGMFDVGERLDKACESCHLHYLPAPDFVEDD